MLIGYLVIGIIMGIFVVRLVVERENEILHNDMFWPVIIILILTWPIFLIAALARTNKFP